MDCSFDDYSRLKVDHLGVLGLVHIADGYRRKGYVLNGCGR